MTTETNETVAPEAVAAAATASDATSNAGEAGTAQLRRARAHFLNLFAGEAGNKILRFASAVVLARILTSSSFGIFNVGIAIAGVLVTASTLGLPELGGRTVAAQRKEARMLVVPILVGRLMALGLATIVFVGIGSLVWPEQRLFYFGTLGVAFAMTLTPDWLARGLERMRTVGAATMLGGFVALAGALAIAPVASAGAALVVFAIAELAVALACWIGVRDSIRPISLKLDPLRPLLTKSWPLGLATVVTYAYYANVDTVVVAGFHGAESAGVYSAAYRVFLAFNVIPIFVAYATFPILARLTDQNADSAYAAVSAMLARLLAYGACVVGVVEIGGEFILRTLFGGDFTSGATAFTLLAIASAWYAVGYGPGYSLIAMGQQRGFVAGAIVAGVVTIGFDLILIPPFGIIGAALATVAGVVGATLVWLNEQRLDRRRVARAIAALAGLSVTAGVAAAVPRFSSAVGLLTLAVTGALLAFRFNRNRRDS
jgi:O-antigen/teichoic acid export membrane protein